eukprot:5117402-Pleurochrysis_carterae.AAC.1
MVALAICLCRCGGWHFRYLWLRERVQHFRASCFLGLCSGPEQRSRFRTSAAFGRAVLLLASACRCGSRLHVFGLPARTY